MTPSLAPSATPSTSGTPSTSAAPPTKADAKHGLLTFANIRTEDDPRDLQQPPQFARSPGATIFMEGVGVSPDGKRVAMIRTGQTGQQLITFATDRPNDVTIVVDFAGSGENPGGVVWAGDGAGSVLFAVHKPRGTSPQGGTIYASLRVADVASKQVREIARITNGSYFLPLAWRSDRRVAGAAEVAAGSANTYDLVREGARSDLSPESTPLGVAYGALTASRDGTRIATTFEHRAVRWWNLDQPSAMKELMAPNNSGVEYAAFRPGRDEIGVDATAPVTGGGVPPPGHFEIWSLSGPQRVVSTTVGFALWRVDGTAALMGTLLIDPDTGATTQLPGGAFKIVDVVAF
jgi:hypothetical protein